MTHYNYPTPTASPYTDFKQYIPLLISAVQADLDRADVWDSGSVVVALGYVQELLAFLCELEDILNTGLITTEVEIAFDSTFPVLLKSVKPGETIDECLITVDTAFDTGSLSIGDAVDNECLFPAAYNSLLTADEQYQVSPQYRYPADADVFVYLTGTPVSGIARVTLYTYQG